MARKSTLQRQSRETEEMVQDMPGFVAKRHRLHEITGLAMPTTQNPASLPAVGAGDAMEPRL